MRSESRQQGAALIIALVIMSIALAITANTLFRQQLNTRLAINIGNLEQIYPYATGLEDFARVGLIADYENDPDKDDLTEAWATTVNFPIDGGNLSGQLTDLQAKFNLNNLLPYDPDADDIDPDRTTPALTTAELALLDDKFLYEIADVNTQNLLTLIDPLTTISSPDSFIDVVGDWIDSDSLVSSGGAESSDYQIEDPAYQAANTLMVNTTEIRLLKDIDQEQYDLLKEHVSTLPEYTKINVNTADKNTLQALGFTAADAQTIIDDRPFDNLADFTDRSYVQAAIATATGATSPAVYEESFSVTSQYFLLEGEIQLGAARLYINSILYRDNATVTVLSRDFSNQQL